LARTQDAAATSLILGHGSPAMLFRHYRERVTPEDARKWFEVMPRDGETIIAMDGKR
jgi:hypothetical protein